MITGFNTDIEFEGKVYHVQTEDKGLARPMILSLVYDRGTILASKRSPYEDLLTGKFDENVLAERLQKQHRTICAAIKSGRIEDLKRMSEKEVARLPEPEFVSASGAAIPKPASFDLDIASGNPATVDSDPVLPIPRPMPEDLLPQPEDAIFEDYAIIEEEIVFPDEAIEIVSEMSGKERPGNTRLTIELIGETKFKGGEKRTLTVMICRGSKRKIVGSAQIMVKILGSSFRPLIFHARTDKNGIASVSLQIPNFSEGRAALLVRATSDGEEVELRRVVYHG